MSIQTMPELAAELSEIASRTGRDLPELATGALKRTVERDGWSLAELGSVSPSSIAASS